jgi:hypothetical protein
MVSDALAAVVVQAPVHQQRHLRDVLGDHVHARVQRREAHGRVVVHAHAGGRRARDRAVPEIVEWPAAAGVADVGC